MKFTINREDLLKCLLKVEKALISDAPIRIVAKDNRLSFYATNHEIFIKSSMNDVYLNEEGEVLIPGKYFIEIIKKFNSNAVKITELENGVAIECDKVKFKLRKYLSDNTIEHLIKNEETNKIKIKTNDFKSLISKTIIAVSDNRPKLMGVNIKIKDNKINAYGTNAFKLAFASLELDEQPLNDDKEIIIPSRSLNGLLKVLDGEYISFSFNSNYAVFEFDNTIFETRLIEGKFPECDNLFNINSNIFVKLNKRNLINAIQRTMILADKEFNAIILDIKEKSTIISTYQSEIGNANEELNNLDNYGTIKICLNAEYLLNAIKAFDDEEIIINLSSEIKPIIITDYNSFNHKHLILPIRMNS